MKKQPPSRRSTSPAGRDLQLVVWGERHPEPDWDRFLRALIALALRRVDEAAEEPEEEHG